MFDEFLQHKPFLRFASALYVRGVPPAVAVQIAAACCPAGAAKESRRTGIRLMRSRVSRSQAMQLCYELYQMPSGHPQIGLHAVRVLLDIYGEPEVERWYEQETRATPKETNTSQDGYGTAATPASSPSSKKAADSNVVRHRKAVAWPVSHGQLWAAWGVVVVLVGIVIQPMLQKPANAVVYRNPMTSLSNNVIKPSVSPATAQAPTHTVVSRNIPKPQPVHPEVKKKLMDALGTAGVKAAPASKGHAMQTEAELRRAVVEASEALRLKDYRRTLETLQPFMSDKQPQQLRDSIIWGRALRLMHDAHSERLSGVAGLQAVDDRVNGMQEIAVLRHRLMKNALARGQQEEARSFYRDADTLYNEVLAEADSALAYGKAGSRLRQAVALALENKATMRVQLARRLHGLALWQEAEELLVNCTKFHQNHLDLPKADLERVAKKLQTLRIERKS
jgi:hypothetical protein